MIVGIALAQVDLTYNDSLLIPFLCWTIIPASPPNRPLPLGLYELKKWGPGSISSYLGEIFHSFLGGRRSNTYKGWTKKWITRAVIYFCQRIRIRSHQWIFVKMIINVPVNKDLLTGTLPVNKELLTGTFRSIRNYWPEPFRSIRIYWPERSGQ